MKKLTRLLFLFALVPVGCVTLPVVPWQPETPPSEEVFTLEPPPPPPIVLPEQVTQQNAAESLRALKAELDYENRHGKR